MKIVSTAQEMLTVSRNYRANGEVVAFVPTMGALHQGHISLFEKAKKSATKLVVSVFVNPTQFNNPADLINYPRTYEEDREILLSVGADVMFFPSESEIYPNEGVKTYDLDGLDRGMEGPNRPGHFNGVVQVVTRLFDLVDSQKAFFGEKDFQQLAILRHMSRKLGYQTEVIGCETVRESSGLAMSSRNMRLSAEGKARAVVLSECLLWVKAELSKHRPVFEVLASARARLNKVDGVTLEYLELVDSLTLQIVDDSSDSIQACVAAYVDGVRLIDNMKVK